MSIVQIRRIRLTIVALTALMAVAQSSAFAAADEQQARSPQKAGRAHLQAEPLIINGAPIAIQSAPWQTYLESTIGPLTAACGGSIYDTTHVITAAHCVFDAANVLRPPASFTVVAGVSNLAVPAPGDAPQTRAVTAVRVHPLYNPAAGADAPDDVAVLQLAAPLTLGIPTAQAIALAGGGSPAEGTIANITGFGSQAAGGMPNGQLYGLDTALTNPLICGGPANALLLCVSASTGSACEGDSGGPLTIGSPASLAGVTSFGPPGCDVGSVNGYTNVTAGEIGQFIAGSDTPPLAPRGGTDILIKGILEVGGSVTCSPGSWSNGPTFAYTFLDTRSGAALQSGPSAKYTFKQADIGARVACRVAATTAGGTGISLTDALPPVAAAPPAKTPKPALSVKPSKRTINSGGSVSLSIRLSNHGEAAATNVIVCDTPGKGLVFRATPTGAKRSNGRACLKISSLGAHRTRTVRVKLRATRTTRTRTRTNKAFARASNASTRRVTTKIRVRGARRTAPAPGVTG